MGALPLVNGKPGGAGKIAKKPYLSRGIDGAARKNRLWADCLASRQTCGFKRRVPLMATVPGKAPTPPTVTLKHLAAALAEVHEMSKKQAETVLGNLVENIVTHLKTGERIRIAGLGILTERRRAAPIARTAIP